MGRTRAGSGRASPRCPRPRPWCSTITPGIPGTTSPPRAALLRCRGGRGAGAPSARPVGEDLRASRLMEPGRLAPSGGFLTDIFFAGGRAAALPLPDVAVDVALSSTVFEEGDAGLMLSEIVRVTRPGGRVGITVRAIDMPFWVNLPLDPALKAKVDAPGLIGGGAGPQRRADLKL